MAEKNNEPILTRRQSRKSRNGLNTPPPQEVSGHTRRDFLKMVLPGGYLPEVIKSKEEKLSRPAKISILKDTILIPAVGAAIYAAVPEGQKQQNLKEKILSFTWKDAQDSKKLTAFVDDLANEYLVATQSNRVAKNDLVGENGVTFFDSTEAYTQAIKVYEPDYEPSGTNWGYTHYDSKKVFIDLENLKRQGLEQNTEAGLSLTNALWHEWGHLDVTERMTGELINNPEAGFHSPNSNTVETFQSYKGGLVQTETYFGFARFDEVWNETINVRRMIEHIGLEEIISAGDYYQNGVNFLPKLTQVMGISLATLYQMHATSDFEGFARLVGSKLPGDKPALEKGVELFVGIHQADSAMIENSGAFDVISQAEQVKP